MDKVKLMPSSWRVVRLLAVAAFLLMPALAVPERAQARGPESVADLAEGLVDTVVNISTSQTIKGPRGGVPLPNVPKGSPFEDFFEDFFNRQQQQGQPRRVNSLGSGFVLHPSGLIVTNNHVIEGADEIVVNFNDGSKLTVTEVLGRDRKTDLALLRVEPKTPLKAVRFGDSSKLRVGDWVMAIGNPFSLGGTVTVGIVSALKRDINAGPYDEFLQTDAAINRGNSGGPLFDMDGNVVGVNTAIISPTGGSIGIGFAIPSTTVSHVIAQLREFGETRRGWLGVRIQTVTDEIADSLGMDSTEGAMIASVTPDGPAANAGIEAGDVILEFDGQQVDNMRLLPRIVARAEIGKEVDVKVRHKGETRTLKVSVGRLPEDEEAEAAAAEDDPEPDGPDAGQPEGTRVLGLALSPVTDELRSRFKLSNKVQGVVVTAVDPSSAAAQKNIAPGDVIVEVTQEEVTTPDEVVERIEAVKASDRNSILLLISDSKGELRFVAVPVNENE